MKLYVLSAGASEDIDQAMAWYRAQQEGLQHRFANALEVTLQKVCEHPEQGAKYLRTRKQYRKTSVFPYLVVYEEREQDILVLAVAHERRRPQYWQRP